jgi:hypothetical protein
MSETIPPPLENAVQPKTSALAIWSLVLGILSLACFTIFTAIPSVICGHKALSKIKLSNGTLAGQGLAVAGGHGLHWDCLGRIIHSTHDGNCDSEFRQGPRHGANECLYQQSSPD